MNRDCWTRTNDPLVPNQMRYQTALNPDIKIGAGLNFYRHPHSNNRYSVTNVGNQYSQKSTVSWLCTPIQAPYLSPSGFHMALSGTIL